MFIDIVKPMIKPALAVSFPIIMMSRHGPLNTLLDQNAPITIDDQCNFFLNVYLCDYLSSTVTYR